MKMVPEGRGFSPAVTGNSLSPDPSPASGRGGTTKWWVRALTAGLKPRPSGTIFMARNLTLVCFQGTARFLIACGSSE